MRNMIRCDVGNVCELMIWKFLLVDRNSIGASLNESAQWPSLVVVYNHLYFRQQRFIIYLVNFHLLFSMWIKKYKTESSCCRRWECSLSASFSTCPSVSLFYANAHRLRPPRALVNSQPTDASIHLNPSLCISS